jgi:hypothetical protein
MPVLSLFVFWFGGERRGFADSLGLLLLYSVSSWVAGTALARLIEFPMLRWRDRLFPQTARR